MPTTLRTLPAAPANLRVTTAGRPVRVDRANGVILGYVMAQEGPFKTPGRGEFDRDSLKQIVAAAKAEPKGLRVRFQHPGLSDDGLGKYLGRSLNPWLDTSAPVWKARADLHFAAKAFDAPAGNLAGYVLGLAEEDPDALSSSLCVGEWDEVYRLHKDGTPVTDEDGDPLPPLWRVKSLTGSDIVDTGDAVDGLLSVGRLDVDSLPDALQRRAWEALGKLFAGQPADVVRQRCGAFVERYLSSRGGGADHLRDASKMVDPPATVKEILTVDPRPNRERAGRIVGRLRAGK